MCLQPNAHPRHLRTATGRKRHSTPTRTARGSPPHRTSEARQGWRAAAPLPPQQLPPTPPPNPPHFIGARVSKRGDPRTPNQPRGSPPTTTLRTATARKRHSTPPHGHPGLEPRPGRERIVHERSGPRSSPSPARASPGSPPPSRPRHLRTATGRKRHSTPTPSAPRQPSHDRGPLPRIAPRTPQCCSLPVAVRTPAPPVRIGNRKS